MNKTLPKGHVSCLSEAFRYTGAANTNISKTFARIRRQLGRQEQSAAQNVCVLPQRKVSSGRSH
ncbi:MAG: hypothetical protein ACREVS_11825 [Burkholderiales bacterium]